MRTNKYGISDMQVIAAAPTAKLAAARPIKPANATFIIAYLTATSATVIAENTKKLKTL